MAPSGRLKSSIVGTDLLLVGTEFELSSNKISWKRGFGLPCHRALNTPILKTT